jgi:hypothetical protein
MSKFTPDDEDVIGKFSTSEPFYIVLFAGKADNLIPVLRTFDEHGDQISEQVFFQNYCGRTLDFYSTQHLCITRLLEVTEIDTALEFRMNEGYESILDTLKREVVVRAFWIDKTGAINGK